MKGARPDPARHLLDLSISGRTLYQDRTDPGGILSGEVLKGAGGRQKANREEMRPGRARLHRDYLRGASESLILKTNKRTKERKRERKIERKKERRKENCSRQLVVGGKKKNFWMRIALSQGQCLFNHSIPLKQKGSRKEKFIVSLLTMFRDQKRHGFN